MIPVMKAIEYNSWMSLLDAIGKMLPTLASDYGLSGVAIDILPAYPRDLTRFNKPSIIVQKIHTSMHSIGFGNVVGLLEDENGAYDVTGTEHNIIYQINVDAINNTQCSLISSLLAEGIILPSSRHELVLDLNDYITNIKNPTLIGRMDVGDEPDIIPMSSNENKDYIDVIRFDISIIQTVVHNDPMIDLSKPIKWTQTIKL